jgi:hypothetical protein
VFWRSTDGLTWSLTDSFRLGRCLAGCPWIEDLAAGPGGVVLSWAHAVEAERRAPWWSRDGSTWAPIDTTALGLSPGAYMRSNTVLMVEDRFVLTGSVDDEWRVWSSLDGLDWTLDGTGGQQSYDLELASDGRRVVAMTNSFPEDRETAVWTSPDGRAGWTLETQLPIWQPSLTFAANMFIAGGAGPYPDPHLLTSADGRSWTEINHDLSSCNVGGLFGALDRVLLVSDDCPGIWVSLAPRS